MGYPAILSFNGNHFARVNHDYSWSVKWPETIDIAYGPIPPQGSAIVGLAKLLVAAKDNFYETSWEISDSWANRTSTMNHFDIGKPENVLQIIGLTYSDHLAKINLDATWSVKWKEVVKTFHKMKGVSPCPAIAIVTMLMAAKDNFITTPWDAPPEQDC